MVVNFIYMTASSKTEAQKIGKALVESRLAACVNILDNMQSIYRWEEKVQEDAEVVLIAKTTESLVAQLIDKVKSSDIAPGIMRTRQSVMTMAPSSPPDKT